MGDQCIVIRRAGVDPAPRPSVRSATLDRAGVNPAPDFLEAP